MATATIIKRKRVSKRSKLSWRKHTKVEDVEEFLEEKRLEERLGPSIDQVSNDQLFQIDTKADKNLLLSLKERKRLKLSKPPRCFAILESHTKVPDPITKRNRVKSKEERQSVLAKKKQENVTKIRRLQSLKDRKSYEEQKTKQQQPKKDGFNQNIWADEEKTVIEKDEWFGNNTKKHNLLNTGKVVKTVRKPPILKTSLLPSVEIPHPGMSYNPSYKDHTDLLKLIADKEEQMIKQKEHLIRVTDTMFKKTTEDKRDNVWLVEMSEGLVKTETEIKEENDGDAEYKPLNPPVQNKKKTLKQRRKQREQLKLQLERKTKLLEKKKVSDLHRLRLLKKQIEKKQVEEQKLSEKREKLKSLKPLQTKRLNSLKFEDNELEFNLGRDLSGNLRNMKKEGNALMERFKSLQKRNILEPTIRRQPKKAKIKIFTKPDHKDNWKQTVAR